MFACFSLRVPYQNHFGNLALRDIVSRCWHEYDSAKQGAKAGIASRVVEEVQRNGGRFLKLDKTTEWWFPVSQKEAQQKVSQAFRKKREMDLSAASCCVKKDVGSGKRSKVLQASQQDAFETTPKQLEIPLPNSDGLGKFHEISDDDCTAASTRIGVGDEPRIPQDTASSLNSDEQESSVVLASLQDDVVEWPGFLRVSPPNEDVMRSYDEAYPLL